MAVQTTVSNLFVTLFPGHKNGDILQAGIVISYILYQTWRALHSKPSGDFNSELTCYDMQSPEL